MLNFHKHLEKFFKVFSSEQRIQILEILKQHDRINVGDIVKQTTISQPTVSHHLRLMLEADIISQEKSGKEIYYKLKPKNVDKCCRACMGSFGVE